MDQPAEAVPAQNAHTGHFRRQIRTTGGRVLPQRPVWAMQIAVIGVLTQDQPQVLLSGRMPEGVHVWQDLPCGHG